MDNPGLSVNDFSQGVTDYFFQGDVKRYQYADNFELTTDKKLRSRMGSEFWLGAVQGKFYLPAQSRIDAFHLLLNETEIMLKAGSKMYGFLTGSWAELKGPAGNDAAPGATYGGYIYSGELATTSYFTGEGMAHPSYIYKDQSNSYQVRTLGLPKPVATAGYTKASLLLACITLANDIRSSMIGHFSDTGYHAYDDRTGLSFFQSVVFRPAIDIYMPVPFPTPAAAATDEASLYKLINSLIYAYSYHLFGGTYISGISGYFTPVNSFPNNFYHRTDITFANVTVATGTNLRVPNVPMTVNAVDYNVTNSFPNLAPTTLDTAASYLDELRMKWAFHRNALLTHSPSLSSSTFNNYAVTAPEIGNPSTTGSPVVTPDYSQFFTWVDGLKTFHNLHVSNGAWNETTKTLNPTGPGIAQAHYRNLDSNNAPINMFNAPTTLTGAYISLAWTRRLYAWHLQDADTYYLNGTMDTTASSANVTDVKVGGALYTLPPFGAANVVLARFPTYIDGTNIAKTVGFTASGTATLSKALLNNGSDILIQVTPSNYHTYDTSSSFQLQFTNSPNSPVSAASKLQNNSAVGVNLEDWTTLGQELLSCFQLHITDAAIHFRQTVVSPVWGYTIPKNFYTPVFADYAYAAIWRYKYKDFNGTEFEQVSEPLFWSASDVQQTFPVSTLLENGLYSPSSGQLYTVSNTGSVLNQYPSIVSRLPQLLNDATTNYDVTNVELVLYRTSDGGKIYYELEAIKNGTTTYSDNVNDLLPNPGQLALTDRATLYTTGGVVSFNQPPKSKVMHITNATAYYGGVYDGDAFLSNRILQSIPGRIFAAPPTFYVDLDDEVVMVSSARNSVIGLAKSSIYRLQGGFNLLGQGSFSYEKISDSMGCISAASVVQTELGVFFAGTDGFYYTDGYQLIKISLDLDISYAKWTKTDSQRARLEGKYDRLSRRIYWKVQTESTTDEANEIWSFYLNYGVKPSGVFTPFNGTSDTFRPTALTVFNRAFLKADQKGIINEFRRDIGYDVNCSIDPSTLNPYAYKRVAIPFRYGSCALDYGDTRVGQYATTIHLISQNRGNYAAQFTSVTENNNIAGKRSLAAIVSRLNFWWGYDFSGVWGSEVGMNWKFDGKDDVNRRFPSSSLRSSLRAMYFEPVETAYYSNNDFQSDVIATAIFTGGQTRLNFSRVDNSNDVLLPIEVIGMSVLFEIDDYTTGYEITSIVNNVGSASYFVLATQPSWVTASPSVPVKWEIFGKPINAGVEISSYDIGYISGVAMGRTYQGYIGSENRPQ